MTTRRAALPTMHSPGVDVSPLKVVKARVGPSSTFSARARHVALVLVLFWVNRNRDEDGNFSCWPSHSKISRASGLSVSVVQRALKELCDGPRPLFSRQWARSTSRDGITHRHTSNRYVLVEHPRAYARVRDRQRDDLACTDGMQPMVEGRADLTQAAGQ